MTAIEASLIPLSEPGLVKMDDRKRPSPYDHSDAAPPSKKIATGANGAGRSHPDEDMPWRDDLEVRTIFAPGVLKNSSLQTKDRLQPPVDMPSADDDPLQRFQKDAIHRQMLEYKREKKDLEARLQSLQQDTKYHDDHLRIIDSWFMQLIDEVKLLAASSMDTSSDLTPFESKLLFADQGTFEEHLKARSADIRGIISALLDPLKRGDVDTAQLQSRLAQLLADEKIHIVELERAESERKDVNDRLDAACLRYMKAEKKLDRVKSTTAAKFEKHALGAIKTEDDNVVKREDSTPNGTAENGEVLAELEESHNRVVALSEKQASQLIQLEAENAKLTSQLTDLAVKNSRFNDDDYAGTDLFKQLKAQHEDVIKRVNNLEARNVELQAEALKLQSERSIFKTQIEAEAVVALGEKDAALSAAEENLARIRANRDELLADQAIKKSTYQQEWLSHEKAAELQNATDERLQALELENERLKGQVDSTMVDASEMESSSPEEIRSKYVELEAKYKILNSELASMQTAYAKSNKLARQNFVDLSSWEEKVARLSAEKAKADQKYFAAMKSKETREGEVRVLKAQNAKHVAVVTQLKDAETAARGLLASLEKQLSEVQDALTTKTNSERSSHQKVLEANIQSESLKIQIAELKKTLAAKDSANAALSSAYRKAESEVEQLKSTLTDTKKSLETWKAKGLGNKDNEYEMLRMMAICTVCRKNFKDTVIKTCGHLFCKDCVEERQASRSRKCPNCNKSFGANDSMRITL